MKDKKLKLIIGIITIILIIIFIIGYFYESRKNEKSNYVKIDTESTDLDVEYSDKELTGEWSDYVAKINLSDTKTTIEGSGVTNSGNTITIKSAGTYYITGNISDGNILIEANKNDEVQLVLDNVSITSKTTSPINSISGSKLTITLADNSENTITDSNSYTTFTDTENQEPDGAIFTKTDLVINGDGELVINANCSDGIVSKDGLKVINSNIEINSADDGIRGKDYIAINNANINITSKGDGIKSTNDTDAELGYIAIEGGKININAGDDGIHSETKIVINGGNIDITKSYEGIESGYIEINGGTINVVSSDDGINISGGNDSSSMNGRMGQNNFSSIEDSNRRLVINSGNIIVNANGDGLDSNGSIYINGGNILVEGPTNGGNGALDYDSECVVTGGNIVIYGATGMWQNPSNNSTQYSLTFQTSGNSGNEIVLKDSSGNEITSLKTEKSYGAITISNSNIEKGKTYTLYVNGSTVGSLTANSVVTSNSSLNGNGGMQGGKGMQPDGMQPNRGGKPQENF